MKTRYWSRRVDIRVLCVGLVGLFGGCGSGDSPARPNGGGSSLPPDLKSDLSRPDVTTFDVAWKTDTVVVDDDEVRGTLQNPFPADGVYLFDPSAANLLTLAVNSVVFLPGVGIFHVVSVAEEGGQIALHTTPAALDEAADQAHIAWDVAFPALADLFDTTTAGTANFSQKTEALRKPSAVPETEPAMPASTTDETLLSYDYMGTVGSFQTSFSVTPEIGEPDKMSVVAFAKADLGDSSVAALKGSGWASRFRAVGEIVVTDGAFVSAHVGVRDAMVSLTIDSGTAKVSGQQVFDFPSLLTIPFSAGGLPFFVKLGGGASFDSTASVETSILGKATYSFRGEGDVTVSPTGIQGSGNITEASAEWSEGEGTSTVTAGLGITVDFPRVQFGLGLPNLPGVPPDVSAKVAKAWATGLLPKGIALADPALAEVHLALTSEMVFNQTVIYDSAGGFPVIVSNCGKVSLNAAVFLGGSIPALGPQLSKLVLPALKDMQLAGWLGKPIVLGKDCN